VVSCTPEETNCYPLNYRLFGPQSWSGHFGEEINVLSVPVIEEINVLSMRIES
jgi:hypothetical protein